MSDTTNNIPLIILHGSLGSGKTTALRMLLEEPSLKDALIIENDVAEWNVDAETLHQDNYDVIPLSGGCVCCGSANDLKTILENIVASGKKAPVILETTGVARINRLLQWFLFHTELYSQFSLRHVVMVVDLLKSPIALYHERELDMKLSDMVLCTKKDLVQTAQYDCWMSLLHAMGDKVRMNTDNQWIADALAGTSTWLARLPEEFEQVNEQNVMSKVFDCKPIAEDELRSLIEKMFMLEKADMQRVKGYVQTTTGKWFHIEATDKHIDIRPSDPASRSAIICIGTHIDRHSIESLITSYV